MGVKFYGDPPVVMTMFPDREASVVCNPSSEFQAQLDRIEMMLDELVNRREGRDRSSYSHWGIFTDD